MQTHDVSLQEKEVPAPGATKIPVVGEKRKKKKWLGSATLGCV